jgi:hypothetical protein
MLLAAEDLPRHWVTDVQPNLDAAWAAAAGLFNANPRLTITELAAVQARLEDLIEPYLNRDHSQTPATARPVRLLAYFLPGPEGGTRRPE